jgi:hypothetical protein
MLNLRADSAFIKKLEPGEEVLFSSKLTKINRRNKAQARCLGITNKRVFNVKGKNTIKRSIVI